MSDDRTAEIAADLAVTRKNLRVLRNSTHFVPHAMNQGIEASRAPFVGRIDGHCLVLPGYFAGCLSRHRAGRFDCVGGVMVHEGVTETGRAMRLTRAVLATTTGGHLLVIAGEALRLAWTRGCSWTRCALALMTMHVAYGAGLLRAVCDWVLGRKLGSRLTALSR